MNKIIFYFTTCYMSLSAFKVQTQVDFLSWLQTVCIRIAPTLGEAAVCVQSLHPNCHQKNYLHRDAWNTRTSLWGKTALTRVYAVVRLCEWGLIVQNRIQIGCNNMNNRVGTFLRLGSFFLREWIKGSVISSWLREAKGTGYHYCHSSLRTATVTHN